MIDVIYLNSFDFILELMENKMLKVSMDRSLD
jgi:hypothetical protein